MCTHSLFLFSVHFSSFRCFILAYHKHVELSSTNDIQKNHLFEAAEAGSGGISGRAHVATRTEGMEEL